MIINNLILKNQIRNSLITKAKNKSPNYKNIDMIEI